jgi:hypothetical protein
MKQLTNRSVGGSSFGCGFRFGRLRARNGGEETGACESGARQRGAVSGRLRLRVVRFSH